MMTLRLIDFYNQRTAKIRGTDSRSALVATSAEQVYYDLFLNRQNTLFDVGRSMFDVGRSLVSFSIRLTRLTAECGACEIFGFTRLFIEVRPSVGKKVTHAVAPDSG